MKLKTYVINMEKDKVKKESILSQISNHNQLMPEIIRACEGSKLTEEQQIKLGYSLFKGRYGYGATLPAFGCAISHHLVYTLMSTNENNYALILEDDAIICDKIDSYLEDLINFISSKETPCVILLTPEFIYQKSSHKFKCKDHFITSVIGGYMNTGYMLNKQAAKLLSSSLFPIRYVADAWSAFVKLGIDLYGVFPHLISYGDQPGEIGQSIRTCSKRSIMQKFLHKLGRMKAKILNIYMFMKGIRWSKKIWQ